MSESRGKSDSELSAGSESASDTAADDAADDAADKASEDAAEAGEDADDDSAAEADEKADRADKKAAGPQAKVRTWIVDRSKRRDPPGVALLRTIDNGLGTAEHGLLCVLLFTLVATGAAQILVTQLGWRGIGFEGFLHLSTAELGDIIKHSVFFIAMTGAALSAHTEQLISMDFVTRLLPASRRAWLRLLLRLFTVAMCILLAVGGATLRQGALTEEGELIPPSIAILAIPIGAILLAIHVLLHFSIDLLFLVRGRTPPERTQVAAH